MKNHLQSVCCALALLVLGAAGPARAQIDLTGTYDLQFLDYCQTTVTQTGTSIQFNLQCVFLQAGAIGTIDPITGVFSATGGCTVGPLFGTFQIDGTAAPDSASFAGMLTCPPNALPGQHSYTAERHCPESPSAGCRTASKSMLIVERTNQTTDKLLWKWLKGDATTQEDFGMPTGTSGYTLCIYSGTVAADVFRARVPNSASLWKTVGTKGWKYTDRPGTADGVQKVLLKGGAAGRSKVLVKGKDTALPFFAAGTLPVATDEFPVIVQLLRNSTPTCWESAFQVGDAQLNTADRFKAKRQTP